MQPRLALTSLELTLAAGRMTPLHAHDMEETFLVLDGSLAVHAGGETAHVGPGNTLTVPANVPHALATIGRDVRYVASTFVLAPERYAEFMRAVAVPTGDRPADDDAVVEFLARANGITVLGPPGSLPLR
jgi:quercetin dioxygenase-like cupin family protein